MISKESSGFSPGAGPYASCSNSALMSSMGASGDSTNVGVRELTSVAIEFWGGSADIGGAAMVKKRPRDRSKAEAEGDETTKSTAK